MLFLLLSFHCLSCFSLLFCIYLSLSSFIFLSLSFFLACLLAARLTPEGGSPQGARFFLSLFPFFFSSFSLSPSILPSFLRSFVLSFFLSFFHVCSLSLSFQGLGSTSHRGAYSKVSPKFELVEVQGWEARATWAKDRAIVKGGTADPSLAGFELQNYTFCPRSFRPASRRTLVWSLDESCISWRKVLPDTAVVSSRGLL